MADQICYCFGYTDEDIVKDVLANRGVSTILDRIVNQKKAGGCNCGSNHPLGR